MLAVEKGSRRTGLGAALVAILMDAMANVSHCHEVRVLRKLIHV